MLYRVVSLAILLYSASLYSEPSGSFIYKVESGHNYIYLAGSVHMGKKGQIQIPYEYDYAFRNTDILVNELITSGVPENYQSCLVAKIVKPLKDRVGEVEYLKFKNFVKTQVNEKNFERAWEFIEISEVSTYRSILLYFIQQERGISHIYGVEETYARNAMFEKKLVRFGLESLYDRCKSQEVYKELFSKYSDSDLLAYLQNSSPRKGMDQYEKSLTFWNSQDFHKFETAAEENRVTSPEIFLSIEQDSEKIDVTDRNELWIPRIQMLLEGNSTAFVLVGSAHLSGDKALQKLLARKGYKVEKFSIKNHNSKSCKIWHEANETTLLLNKNSECL